MEADWTGSFICDSLLVFDGTCLKQSDEFQNGGEKPSATAALCEERLMRTDGIITSLGVCVCSVVLSLLITPSDLSMSDVCVPIS